MKLVNRHSLHANNNSVVALTHRLPRKPPPPPLFRPLRSVSLRGASPHLPVAVVLEGWVVGGDGEAMAGRALALRQVGPGQLEHGHALPMTKRGGGGKDGRGG
jgi:hypothetical protein